ncbi:MAG: penicillin-binding protein [Solirubrobacteraceae bacterium]|jgi:cell division protein FtsI/penicillin-binding protein 2|nr:penicillin-binding protein [Solirubrobacteraceae bacterium]
MFSSAPSRRSGVAWIEPGRRRRRSARHRPLLALVLLLVAAAVVAAVVVVGELRHRQDQRRAVAARFVTAWTRGDERAMWSALDARSQRAYPLARFQGLYDSAQHAATVTSVRAGAVPRPRGGRVTVPVAVATTLFGTLRGPLVLAVHDEGGGARVAWAPHLRLPGLRAGESVRRRVLQTPRRASVLGADGRSMAQDPATAAIAGRAPAGSDPGTGLERLYDRRLAGRPGAELRFGDRVIGRVDVVRGRSVRATIQPSLQRAAAAALGNRLGGVAVVRPRDGAVLALSGLAVSAPQPPGSTFKIVTLSAALAAGIATPASTYPIRTFATLSGVKLRNAGDEACGGTLVRAFADSCNSVFAPLGARLGAKRLVRMAEAFGFNEPVRVPAAKPSSIPQAGDLRDGLAVGASAIGQDRDLATPLGMASVAATIGLHGRHTRPRIVRSDPVVRRRAVSARVAAQVRAMMIGVVRSGTGTAAALPGVEVAGKTGTAELRSTVGGPPDPKNTDAWFVAFAPAQSPRVAVGVMLVGAGAGGKAAAPIAREVLRAALG